MRFNKPSVVLLVAALLIGCTGLFAQTPTATVTGTVLDSSGATVPGAAVKVTNVDTNIVSEKDTNEDGVFTIINLLPGNYVLTVEKTGFKTVALPQFTLDVNQILTEKLTMVVGSTTETVTVSTSAIGQMIQSSSTELGTIIDTREMVDLPMNGRSFSELLIIQPGVGPINTAQGGNSNGDSDSTNTGIPGTISYRPAVNGAGNRSNIWYMDGIIDTNDRGGQWGVPVIVDTIDEFKVQGHNDAPEYGNALGAVVNVITKSGTNAFHGDAWDFAQSQIFEARNPFSGFCNAAQCPAAAAAVAAGTETAAQLSATPVSPLGYTQNEFGGTLGGPIFKNKTFFFIAYEGWHYSTPTNSYTIDPSPAELSGDFSGLSSQCITFSGQTTPICGDSSTPELVGSVNSAKTGVTPASIFNPFAETAGTSVPFYCQSGTDTPMALQNPGASFGQTGYGLQVAGGTPCNVIPSGLIDTKLAQVISAYTASQYKNCAFSPNYAVEVDNCLDSRPRTDDANNMDVRIDQHLGSRDVIFGRAYMLWDSDTQIVAGTTSLLPEPYHAWNIGGAWDHTFTQNLILEVRGGLNTAPVQVNQTNSAGYTPESTAGYTNLGLTSGFYLDPASGYPTVIGNVGPEFRGNPEADVDGMLTWIHGKHTIAMGGEYLYQNRLETNDYGEFTSSTADSCPANSSGNLTCGGNQGNGLASLLLDLPNGYKVNIPQYEEVHYRIAPSSGFVQDSWHIRPTLTVNIGLRYDYDPAVHLLVSNGETVNAMDFPTKQFIIGSTESSAYTTGCTAGSEAPPCVPGGLTSSNPAFNVCLGATGATSSACSGAGGVFYSTLSNIVFSGSSQPALKSIKDNFGPRLGLAWQFLPNTVLRIGYGIYYDTISYLSQYAENTLQGSVWPWTFGVSDTLNTAVAGTSISPTVNVICSSSASCGPYGGYTTSQLTGLIGSNPIVVANTPWGSTFGGYTDDPNYSDPRSQQWNVQIERQLSANAGFSIAYVGSKTARLDWCCFANYPQGGPFCENNPAQNYTCPTTPLTPLAINETEYMPFSAQGLHYAESIGFSNYNALQVQFQKRVSHGLETLVAYTWSRCLGDANGQFNAENGDEGAPYEYFFNPTLSYGPCAYDVPQLFNWSAVYDLPFGSGEKWLTHGPASWVLGNWTADFSFLARSGEAYNPTWGGASSICTTTVTTACVPASIAGVAPTSTDPANLSDTSGSITGYSRPDLVPGCKPVQTQSYTSWFNPACYVSPASLTVGPGYGFGNSPIGNLRTQFFNDTDFALQKNIKITESKTLMLRFEAFNVFNHQVLSNPSASIAPTISGGAISYGSAGVISGIASTPRNLQLAAKFSF